MRMKRPLFSHVLLCAGLLTALILTSCGGSTGATTTPLPVSVSINLGEVNMTFGETRTFSATVTGSLNQMVTWSVQEGSAGGTINSSGVYVAPGMIGTFHIVAASQADTTKSETATVIVGPLSIAIAPPAAIVGLGTTRTFAATVTGSSNTDVTWSVLEGTGGTITKAGVYTAPIVLGTYHIVATSVADISKIAPATVTVVSSGFSNPTGSLNNASGFSTATLLSSGKVLVAGGDGGGTADFVGGIANAELYEPSTGTFAPTGNMTLVRFAHTATRLPSGTVLVTGGLGDAGVFPAEHSPRPSSSAELYDPATGAFAGTASMTTPRAAHTATLLPDGKVLIVGGSGDSLDSNFRDGLTTAELYDPATGAFMPTGSMVTPRYAHTATLLANGKVLVAGGYGQQGTSLVVNATAEFYDPATGSFAPAASMETTRAGHTATLLADGKVLIAGGFGNGTDLLTAEIYDPKLGSFSPTANMGMVRSEHTATLLPSGKVLVAGGESNPFTTELYDPATGSFTASGTMQAGRVANTATLLQNGKTLLAGGEDTASAELFE